MTTDRNDIDELLETLEEIRSSKYPEIPKELIESIVQTEYNGQDNKAQTVKDVRKLIDNFLKTAVKR